MEFNYLVICVLGGRFVGIITRILMIGLGERWNRWELQRAYAKKKAKVDLWSCDGRNHSCRGNMV